MGRSDSLTFALSFELPQPRLMPGFIKITNLVCQQIDVTKPQIHALTGKWVNTMSRVTNKQDSAAQPLLATMPCQWKTQPLTNTFYLTQFVLERTT